MAIKLEFEGAGEGLSEFVKQTRDAVVSLRDSVAEVNTEVKKQATEGVKSQQTFNAAIEVTATTLGKVQAAAEKGGTAKLSKDLAEASVSAEKFGEAIDSAGDESINTLKKVTEEAKKTAAAQGIQTKQLDAQRKGYLDLLVRVGALTKEEAKLAQEAIEVTEAFEGQDTAITGSDQNVKSLRARFAEAKNEAAAMVEQFGRFSPEAQAALQRAASLKDELGDLNDTLDALNPDAKFQAFGQTLTAVAGGFTAVQGAIGLFGEESEEVQKGLLKIQSALAITQGLQAFFGGLGDGLKNIRALLGTVTAATTASTTASRADATAKGAQAVATTAVGTASTAAATGVRAFISTLLASPLAPIIIGLTAVGAAFALLGDDAEEAEGKVNGLFDTLDAVEKLDLKNIDAKLQRNRLAEEQQLVGIDNEKERGRIQAAAANEELRLLRQKAQLLEENAAAKERELDKARENLDIEPDALKAIEERAEASRLAAREAQADVDNAEIKAATLQKGIRLKVREEELKSAEERKAIREKLAKDIEAIEQRLAARVAQAEAQGASPRRKLEIQREQNQKEIDELQRDALRKVAAIEIAGNLSVEAFNNLSEQELNARADALIEQGKVELPIEQQTQFDILRLQEQEEYNRQSAELTRQETETRIALITDASERELAAFNLKLEKEAEALRAAGSTKEEIARAQDAQRADFLRQRTLKDIQLEEQATIARIEAQKRGAESEAKFRLRIELEKLAAQEAFARARLAAIKDDTTKEADVMRAELEKLLAEIRSKREELAEGAGKTDIFDLLGFSFTEEQKAEVTKAIGEIGQAIKQTVDVALEARAAELEAQIANTDAIIEDAQRRRDELYAQLEAEQRDRDAGLANNVDAVKSQIEQTRQAEAKATEDKKKLIAERQKLARQQALADSITQVSSLVTAGASLFADGALKGPGGIATAIATIAGMIAAFVALKARVAQATTQTFERGGLAKSPEGWGHMQVVHGPRHSEGGLGVYNEKTGQRVAEVEGGEGLYVINRRSTAKHIDLLEALNENDMAKTARLAMDLMPRPEDLTPPSSVVRTIVREKERVLHAVHVGGQSTEALERKVDELTSEVRAFRQQEGKRPVKRTLPDGTVEYQEGNTITRIKPRKRA